MELPDHPFFVATLFVAPLSSTADRPHPLVVAFVRAAHARAEQRSDALSD
jgi:CTP synthase (UTP-ammonia lyase)